MGLTPSDLLTVTLVVTFAVALGVCRLFSPAQLAQVAVAAAAPADWHPLPARGDRAGGPARGPGTYPWS